MLSIALIAALSAAEIETAIGIDPAMCRVVRYSADGSRSEQPPTRAFTPPSSNTVSVRSQGAGASSSSVSVSSGAGSGQSRAAVDGRTITATYDQKGCHLVIDERRSPEG